jgi:hypothetical protein
MRRVFHRPDQALTLLVSGNPFGQSVTHPMPGFTSVDAAPRTLTGIELIHRRKKKQRRVAARDEGRPGRAIPLHVESTHPEASTHHHVRENRLLFRTTSCSKPRIIPFWSIEPKIPHSTTSSAHSVSKERRYVKTVTFCSNAPAGPRRREPTTAMAIEQRHSLATKNVPFLLESLPLTPGEWGISDARFLDCAPKSNCATEPLCVRLDAPQVADPMIKAGQSVYKSPPWEWRGPLRSPVPGGA